MYATLRTKKILRFLGVILLAIPIGFISCTKGGTGSEGSEIRISVGSESTTLCGNSSQNLCGTISPFDAQFSNSVTITATPNPGYRVSNWIIDGATTTNSNPGPASIPVSISAGKKITVFINFENFDVVPLADSNDLVALPGTTPTQWQLNYKKDSNSTGFKLAFRNNYLKGKDVDPCVNDVSISVTASNTFVPISLIPIAKPSSDANAYKNQYFCTTSADKSTITLASTGAPNALDFRPIAQQFTIKIYEQTFPVRIVADVNSITSDSIWTLQANKDTIPSGFNGCGQYGTIVQRVFDCSQFITPFAQPLQGSSSVEKSWFVVSCPPYNGDTGNSHTGAECAWLTPEIESNNPAINPPNGTGLNYTDFKTSYYADGSPLLPGKPRLLFSGIYIDNGTKEYSFSGANPNITPTTECLIKNCYGSVSDNTKMAQWTGKDKPEGGEAKYCLNSNTENILPNSLNKNTLQWTMPNYPMLYLITGGKTGSWCSAHPNDKLSCDIATGQNQNGLAAQNVFMFMNTQNNRTKIWSSSYLIYGSNASSQAVRNILLDTDSILPEVPNNTIKANIRCASTTWY